MAALTLDEIRAGIVVYLEEEVLRSSGKVTWYSGKGSEHGLPERRPLLCISATQEECNWVPVTTEPTTGSGYRRLPLEAQWRSGGDANCYGNQWITLDQFLVDGANMYVGPASEFVAASVNECTTAATRSVLSDEGVGAVLAEVSRQAHRRAPTR